MRRLLVGAMLVVLAAPTLTAQAQNGSDLYLPDTLVVAVGETLRIDPGTRIHGPGHIEVRGTLLAVGTAEAPVRFHAPIALHGNQSTRLSHAVVERIPGAAISLFGGHLRIENTDFLGNLAGLIVAGTTNTTLTLQNATFEDHADTALRLGRVGEATLDNVSLRHNTIGLTIRLDAPRPTRLALTNATFEDHADHMRVEVAADAHPGSAIDIVNSRFTGPDGTLVVIGTENAAANQTPRVRLEANRFERTDVALRLEGHGYTFVSHNDTFTGNAIAIASPDATFLLFGTTFDSVQRDLDLGPTARFEAEGVSFTSTPVPDGAGAHTPWPLIAGVVGALAIAVLIAIGFRRRTPLRSVPIHGEDAPLATPIATANRAQDVQFSTMELRILHDIADNPYTAQSATATRLGVSRQSAHYHVKKLVAGGFIIKTDQGRTTACRVAANVRLPPLPPAVTQQGRVEKE